MNSEHKMSISTTQNGKPVTALCDLKNDKSEWSVNAPGELDVARSAADLLISCVSDDGTFAGQSRVESHANGAMYGNLIAGGGWLGMIYDHHTGKGFSYPDKPKSGDQVVCTVNCKGDSGGESQLNPVTEYHQQWCKIVSMFNQIDALAEQPGRPCLHTAH